MQCVDVLCAEVPCVFVALLGAGGACRVRAVQFVGVQFVVAAFACSVRGQFLRVQVECNVGAACMSGALVCAVFVGTT